METKLLPLKELLKHIKKYNPKLDADLITRAYHYSEKMHTGQKRASGEDYFVHPVGVAQILIDLKVDSATISAALLHDVLEDTPVTLAKLREDFGDTIADIVEGLTKIDKVHFDSPDDYTAENLRKVLLATTKDIRVMLIKLADRLHNMRTLKYLRPEKQKRIATETMNIFAPIAHKLGVRYIKGELEDLSLKALQPSIYDHLKDKIDAKRGEREERTKELIHTVKKELLAKDIVGEVDGRAKYFYSIYKKMKMRVLF